METWRLRDGETTHGRKKLRPRHGRADSDWYDWMRRLEQPGGPDAFPTGLPPLHRRVDVDVHFWSASNRIRVVRRRHEDVHRSIARGLHSGPPAGCLSLGRGFRGRTRNHGARAVHAARVARWTGLPGA